MCLVALVLTSISCGEIEDIFDEISDSISDTELPAEQLVDEPEAVEPASTSVPPPPPPTNEPAQPPGQLPSNCDSPATPIATNTMHSLQMHSTTQGYPANCLYYCFQIPGGNNLDIEMSNFNTDLDIYVGFDSIEAVDGVVPEWGQSYDWMSNAFGTTDEEVSIPSPQAGVYYIEVCSYEGESTPFSLEINFR